MFKSFQNSVDDQVKIKENQRKMKEDQLNIYDLLDSERQEVNYSSDLFQTQSFESVSQKQKILKSYLHNIFPHENVTNTRKDQLYQSLFKNKFFFRQSSQQQSRKFTIKIQRLKKSKNYQILEFFCSLGTYSKKYLVLHSRKKSFRHQNYHLIGHGTFGNIFGYQSHEKQKVAIKCIKYDENQIYEFQKIIHEFMIAEIMSSIKVGPKILKRNGFDFVLFPNCMEFEMEMCSSIKMQKIQQDLTMSLCEMHVLKIVHCDIKPTNIMFSKCYNKNVFLDFGIAEILNEELWENTKTTFKGTYQFVGVEMKKLFSKNKVGFVNLYLNDVEMLNNSLGFIISCKQSDLIRNDYQKKQMNHVLCKQLKQERFCEFRFHLYFFQTSSIMTEQFQKLIRKFQRYFVEKGKQNFEEQILDLFYGIKQEVRETLFNQLLWKKSSFWNYFIQLQNQISKIQLSQSSFSNNFVNTHLLVQESKLGNKQKFRLNQLQKNETENLKYILTSIQQIQKFSKEEYFTFILKFTSFWNGVTNVLIDQKEIVAKIMRSLFDQNIDENLENNRYQSQIYLPCQNFVKEKCKSLIWAFSFLLNYCMDGELNDFKSTHLMTILKDCIILGFCYDSVLHQCLEKYLTFLFKEKYDNLLALTVIQCFQVKELVKSHFKVLTKDSPLIEKHFHLQLPNTFKRVLETVEKDEKLKQNVIKKRQDFLKIAKFIQTNPQCTSIYEEKLKFDLIIKKETQIVIEATQNQFFVKKDLSQLQLYEKAILMVCYTRRRQYTKYKKFPKSNLVKSFNLSFNLRESFDVLSLATLNINELQKVDINCINYIEQKINCPGISYYLLVPFKFLIFYTERNKKQIVKIFDLLYFNFPTTLYNFKIFQMINRQKQKLRNYCGQNQCSQHLILRRQNTLKLVQYFSRYPSKYLVELNSCILLIINNYLRDYSKIPSIQKKQIEYQIQLFQIVIQRIQKDLGLNVVTYLYWQYYLIDLRRTDNPQDWFKYNKLKSQIYRKVLNYYHQEIQPNLNKQDSVQNFTHMSNNTQSILLQNHRQSLIYSLTDSLQKSQIKRISTSQVYWKILKIKHCLMKDIPIFKLLRQKYITHIFKRLDNDKSSFQMLVQYSIQCIQKDGIKIYRKFCTNFYQIMRNIQPLDQKLLFTKNLTLYLFKLQSQFKNKINPITLFPIYVILFDFQQYFSSNNELFKKFILKVYILFEQLSALKLKRSEDLQNLTIKELSIQQILFQTLKSLSKNKSKRKKIILLRKILSKITTFALYLKNIFMKYLELFTQKLISFSKPSFLQKKIMKGYQKAAKKIIILIHLTPVELQEDLSNPNANYDTVYSDVYRIILKMREQFSIDDEQVVDLQYQYRKLLEKNSIINCDDLIIEATKTRQKSLQAEYQLLCNKLLRQQGKTYQEISWIQKLNQ